jgi:hypothetical protein
MNLTLMDVLRAARARLVPFPAESAAYLILTAAEQVARPPRRSSLASIVLDADGSVRAGGGELADEVDAERDLRDTLGQLIEVASSPGPALARAAGRAALGDLAALSTELEKALIPFNRSAARRALIRLHRDTERLVEAGRLPAAPLGKTPAEPVRVAERPEAVATPAPLLVQESAEDLPPVRARPTPRPAPGATATELRAPAPASSTPAPASSTPAPYETEWIQVDAVTRPETRLGRVRASRAQAPPRPAPAWVEAELGLEEDEPTDRAPLVLERRPRHESAELAVAEPYVDDETPGMLEVDVEDIVEVEDTPAELGPVAPYAGLPAVRSELCALVEGFEVAASASDAELRRELAALADMDLTPGPRRQVGSR